MKKKFAQVFERVDDFFCDHPLLDMLLWPVLGGVVGIVIVRAILG